MAPRQSSTPSEGKVPAFAPSQLSLASYAAHTAQTRKGIGHLRASIAWFATLPQDVKNDAIYQKTKLTMPVLAIGASANLGDRETTWVRQYATNVTGVVIPNSGHWLYQEHPAELTKTLLQFLG
jgi:pimeloyl-ACP methyl ester carboxylesterase